MEQLQNHIEAQTGKPHLWIACAGIDEGEAEHFELSYLTSVLSSISLKWTFLYTKPSRKQMLAMAGLD